jgi:hypothetical protein
VTVLPPSRPQSATATFKKSSYSGDTSCVEAADLDGSIGVRDSKNVAGAVLEFTSSSWGAFIQAATIGTFTN